MFKIIVLTFPQLMEDTVGFVLCKAHSYTGKERMREAMHSNHSAKTTKHFQYSGTEFSLIPFPPPLL